MNSGAGVAATPTPTPTRVTRTRDGRAHRRGLVTSAAPTHIERVTFPEESRRTLRVAARCAASIRFGAGAWETETEDLGPGGCRFVARIHLRRGEPVQVVLAHRAVPFEVRLGATVAWAAGAPPYRTGVAFARGQEGEAGRFVSALRTGVPALSRAAAAAGRRARADGRERRTPPPLPHLVRADRARALVSVARAERLAGRAAAAAGWLRAALQLVPGDPALIAELHEVEAEVDDGGVLR